MADERTRRIFAASSLLFALVAVGLAIAVAVDRFPRGLTVLACIGAALAVAWWAVPRPRPVFTAGLVASACLLAAAVVFVLVEGRLFADILIVCAAAISVTLGRLAFRVRASLPPADAPRHAVLFYNPKSGGGKAERFHLAGEARKRGIEPRELHPGEDLKALVATAVREGADGLAMAGGDGSQAIVAAAAAEHGLPYACIPAGTRNHFALDLGVDRNDVVGALDAFVDGRERVVDLAEVNGQVFVNNVSLGVYAEAVQDEAYRGAKVRTLLRTAPQSLAAAEDGGGFRWRGPDGADSGSAAVLMVSNDPYRLGRAIGSNTRPRLDLGTLGMAAIRPRDRHVQQWSAQAFEVRADQPVAAGIDGEAVRLEPPLEFRSRPRALRVRIAAAHPGASPSAVVPSTGGGLLRALAAIALGRRPGF